MERVLHALGDGSAYVSGERISRDLGKSRTAVWQWVAALREAGYTIDSSPRRGYRLVERPDRLFSWEVQPQLKTEFIGRTYAYRDRVPSTNDVAKELARDGAPAGLVVVAEEQTAGKGRRGRSWSSPYGKGVWMSVLLRPQLPPSQVSHGVLAAVLGVTHGIEEATGLTAAFQWPNDVTVGGKKVCGILVEMEGDMDGTRHVVIGIGINVNVSTDALPAEARTRATSLRAAADDQWIDRRVVMAAVLLGLEQVYRTWTSQGFDGLLPELRARCSSLDRAVRVVHPKGDWNGYGLDIAADGALLVRRGDGTVEAVYAADVSLRE